MKLKSIDFKRELLGSFSIFSHKSHVMSYSCDVHSFKVYLFYRRCLFHWIVPRQRLNHIFFLHKISIENKETTHFNLFISIVINLYHTLAWVFTCISCSSFYLLNCAGKHLYCLYVRLYAEYFEQHNKQL